MVNKLITIFTPVYNRAYLLQNLYKSLLRQTSQNFMWYVVNDGSTDGSEQLIQNMIAENLIPIKYEYQKNSGKHVAYNRAAASCTTELFMCVDSDDYLTDDAVETLEKAWLNIDDEHKNFLSGIVADIGDKFGNIIGAEFPSGIEEEALSKLYRLGKRGDTALVFRTEVIRAYPFPVFEGERFLREHIIYDEIDEKYKLKVLRKNIYICEYFDDGLSKNATALELKNPRGAALARLHDAKKSTSKYTKIRTLSAFVLFSMISHDIRGAMKEIGALKTIALLPIAFAGYIRYMIKGLLK